MGNRSVALSGPPPRAPEEMRDELPPMRAYGGGPAHRHAALSEDGIGWIGAHGGAGATTLTRLLGGTDLGCRWPDAMLAEPAQVVVVGRSNMDGLRAVSRALYALREGRHPAGMRLLGVVLVADAPGWLPAQLTSRIRLLRSVAPVHRVPWIPAFRLGEVPRRLPKQLLALSALADDRPASSWRLR